MTYLSKSVKKSQKVIKQLIEDTDLSQLEVEDLCPEFKEGFINYHADQAMFVAKLMKNVTIETNSRLGNVPKLVKKEFLKYYV